MRKFRRWLRKPWRRVGLAVCVGAGMGCATFLGTFLTSYRLGIALLVAGFGSACVYFLSAWILRPAPIEPFADGEIGIIIDSNNEWFQRAIALKAASTPLAGRLAFRTAEELMGLPVEQETLACWYTKPQGGRSV